MSRSRRAAAARKKVKEGLQTFDSTSIPFPSVTTPTSSGENSPSETHCDDFAQCAKSPVIFPEFHTSTINAEDKLQEETLHCIAVSQHCFKIGRISVPPALVLACAGVGLMTEKWEQVKGDRRRRMELYKGGWKDIPAGERWWDQALAPDENLRVKRLEVVNKFKDMMTMFS